MTPEGTLTTLYSFCSQTDCADGKAPGTLVQGTDENFYGTTERGASNSCVNGCGTVFKITSTGVMTTLYSFEASGGNSPSYLGALVQGTDGNFYGTTVQGGSNNCDGGCGTVFKITPQGVLTTLHNFTGTTTEGGGAVGAMIQAADGNFYGTTLSGGTHNSECLYGCGTVFKMTPQGMLTTLTLLNVRDGTKPQDGLVQATDGNFYATAYSGGVTQYYNWGTIFEVTPEGVPSLLFSFDANDGQFPSAGLLQATNGTLYGVCYFGGIKGQGTIFSQAVGLGPFVRTLPTSGKGGAAVGILGNDLTGASSVSFNGTAAGFTVNSTGTAINTTVPTGATTGTVQVVTPAAR